MNDDPVLRGAVNDTIGAHPDLVGDYRGGNPETRAAVVDALTHDIEDAWGDRFERSGVRTCVRRTLRERTSTDDTDADPPTECYEVTIDGAKRWHTSSEYGDYDAIHAAAGALLAGAESVEVTREGGDSP